MTIGDTLTDLKKRGMKDGDPYYEVLKEMKKAGAVDIPFAVLAMTSPEAGELFDGKEDVFGHGEQGQNNAEQARRFQVFKQVFEQIFPTETRDEWCGQYSDDPCARGKWMPHSDHGSIMKMIEQSAIDFYHDKNPLENRQYEEDMPRFFWPDFQDAVPNLFEKTDLNARLKAWGKLHSNYKSVLVIDGVSLFHPFIRELLKASPLGWRNTHIGVLILFPKATDDRLEELLEQEIQAEMCVAFARSRRPYFHDLYKFGIHRMRDVTEWLYRHIADLLPPPNISMNTNVYGEVHGIHDILSRGGRR